MSRGRSETRFIVWTFAVLAVPVLYMLSVPPLAVLLYGRGSGMCLGEAMNGDHGWFQWHYAEFYWMCERTPLRETLDAYDRWWWRVTDPN